MIKAGSAARRLTLQFAPPLAADAFSARITQMLCQIDEALQHQHALWVGHCKVLVSEGDNSVYGSITIAGDDVRWSGSFPPVLAHAEVTVYAAIYGLVDSQVAAAIDPYLSLLSSPAAR